MNNKNTDNEVYFLGSPQPDETKRKGKPNKWIWIILCALALLIGIIIFITRENKPDYYFEPEESTVTVENTSETNSIDTIKSYIERQEETINDVPLYIYVTHNAKLSLALNVHNESQDSSIICAMQAADIRGDNKEIVGDFVLKGERLSRGVAKSGFCAIINEKITIGVKVKTPLLEQSIDSMGYFFRQYPLVSNGELVENNPKNKSIRRALAIRNSKIVMVESRSSESFHDFSQALLDIGVTEAIYLVGSANAYGWYVDKNKEKTIYGNMPDDELKNISYIVWRSK